MAKTPPSLKSFLNNFYKNVPEEDVVQMPPEHIKHAAQSHLNFSLKRKYGSGAHIHAYTPTKKKNGWDASCTIIDIVNDDMAFLVDSVVAEIVSRGYHINVFLHPILGYKCRIKFYLPKKR